MRAIFKRLSSIETFLMQHYAGQILTINLFYAFVTSFFKPNNSYNKTLGYDNRGKMEIKAFDIHTYI